MESSLQILGAMWNMIQNNHLLQAAVGYPAANFVQTLIREMIL